MKKKFLFVLLTMMVIIIPFSLIGCNTTSQKDDSNITYKLLSIQDYYDEIKNIADFCGLSIDSTATYQNLSESTNNEFSPNLRFIGPVGNYGNLEIIFYNNLAKVTLENKLFTTQEGNKTIDYSYCMFGNDIDTLYSFTTSNEWVIENTTKENNVSYKMSLQVIYNLIDPQYYELQCSSNFTAIYILNEDKRDNFASTLSFIFGENAQIGDINLTINNKNELKIIIENNNEKIEFLIKKGSQYLEIPKEATNNY